MLRRRKETEASIRSAERRRLEDAAERLLVHAPGLTALEIAVEERRPYAESSESRYVRRYVVERAPAMFDFPCADTRCKDGGHDVTSSILASLRKGLPRFEGEHTCDGTSGTGPCGCVLRYVVTATFRT